MFVVKLFGTDKSGNKLTRIVESQEVRIQEVRKNEFSIVKTDMDEFCIANPRKPRPQECKDGTAVYDTVFVENSTGATTQTVKFY